jgi:hypothetical protein
MNDRAGTTSGGRLSRECYAFLELLAVTWLAVAQPLLDTFQRSAETFVFRRSSAFDIVVFTVLLTFGPAVVLYVVELAVGAIDQVARRWVHRIFVSAAVAVFAAEVALRGTDLVPVAYWLVGGLAGLVTLLALVRFRATHVFLRFLSIAPFLFAAVFLFASPVSEVAFADTAITAGGVSIDDPPPIVMIVFDELPTASLLDGDGQIDAQLFPNFARLADDSTWYRNHSTVSPTTPEAVPALLTGRYPADIDAPPTSGAHPDNLFTLLAGAYEMNVWEQATQLCPASTCPEAGTVDDTGLAALLRDARSVWSDLLTVSREPTTDEPFKVRQSDPSAPDRFQDFVTSVGSSDPPRFDFIHILLPHQPWRHLPSGARDNAEFIAEGLDAGYAWRSDFLAQAARQRHLLQLQRTDELLGELLDRLEAMDRYDESLVVATADHGVAFIADEPIRGVSDRNQEQVMWTPLLVKAPGQVEGEIDDVPLESVDLLPLLADVIGVDLPFATDGSVPAGRPEPDRRRIYRWDGFSDLDSDDGKDYASIDGRSAFAALLGGPAWPARDDDLRLYTLGRHGDLVGRSVDGFDVGPATDLEAEIVDPDETLGSDEVDLDFDDVDPDAEVIPTYVRGTIDSRTPVDLAVTVNGTVVGWCPSFVDTKQGDGTQSFFTLIPERFLAAGANEIEVYTIDRTDGVAVLHPVPVR